MLKAFKNVDLLIKRRQSHTEQLVFNKSLYKVFFSVKFSVSGLFSVSALLISCTTNWQTLRLSTLTEFHGIDWHIFKRFISVSHPVLSNFLLQI